MHEDINFLTEKKDAEHQERQAVKEDAQKKKFRFHNPKDEAKVHEKSTKTDPSSWWSKIKKGFTHKPKKSDKPDLKKTDVKVEKNDKVNENNINEQKNVNHEKTEVAKPTAIPQPVLKSKPFIKKQVQTEALGPVDVNLIPWQDPKIKLSRQLRIYGSIISVIVIVLWGSYVRINSNQVKNDIVLVQDSLSVVDEQLENINIELLAQGSSIAVRQKQLIDTYKSLPIWSKFFDWLESSTDENIYYKSMNVDSESVTLEVIATDYITAARQWLIFQTASDWIDSVKVSEFKKVSKDRSAELVDIETEAEQETEIDFKINLTLNKDKLLYQN